MLASNGQNQQKIDCYTENMFGGGSTKNKENAKAENMFGENCKGGNYLWRRIENNIKTNTKAKHMFGGESKNKI